MEKQLSFGKLYHNLNRLGAITEMSLNKTPAILYHNLNRLGAITRRASKSRCKYYTIT